MSEQSYISGNDEVVDECKIVVRTLDGSPARNGIRLWPLLTGLYPVQMFPLHITYYLLNMFVDLSLS